MTKIVPKFSTNAQTVLCKRYLKKSPEYQKCQHCGEAHETTEDLFERVSYGREDFYNLLASLDFLPGSPTLFNAGIEFPGTGSSCFKFDVGDSMVDILEVGRKAGLVQKWGGGVGYCLSELRPKGSPIQSTHGKACGPVAVLRYYHAISMMITQGGKREGAQMGVLHCNHPDIEDFIDCKKVDPQALSTFNLSVACTDTFMKMAIGDRSSRESHLLQKMAENAYSVGDPGIYFIDTAERANPTPSLGKLTGTNPCGEVPLLDNEACNIGSINLAHFIKDGEIEWTRLQATVELGVDYLDETLDRNSFPDKTISDAAWRTRKLGLGVMGWADMLALLKIPYDSDEAIYLAGEIMKHIQEKGRNQSILLGKGDKGRYPAANSLEDNRRNATVTCIAPTGSIAVIAGCSSGIEPHFSLDYTKYMGDRTPLKVELSDPDKWGGFIPKTALDIGWSWHLRHQAAFQAHTDLAVSKTVNLPSNTTVETIKEIFISAWRLQCKGITVYREGCRSIQALERFPDLVTPSIAFPGSDYDAKVHRFRVGGMKVFLHWGLKPEDNTPGEVFITASKQGSTIDGLLDAVAILISMALQGGVPLDRIADKMRGRRFEPSGLTDNPKIPTASSVLDYIGRYAQIVFLGTSPSYGSGMVCPKCGSSVISQEGCLVCSENCGWSRC